MRKEPSAALMTPGPPMSDAGFETAPRSIRRIPISRVIRTEAPATGCPFSSVTFPAILAALRRARFAGGPVCPDALTPAICAVRYPSLAAATA